MARLAPELRSGPNRDRRLQTSEKLLIGLHTDPRAAFVGARLNPMVRIPLDYVADDEKALLGILLEHRSSVEA